MYISVKNCFRLDEIIKSFEVGYRSFIVFKLKNKYPTLNHFSIAVNEINDSLESSSLILSHKYKSKIIKIKNEVGSHHKRIEDCYNSYLQKDHDNDVPYVSEIIDYVFFFFNDCFSSLSHGFTSIEEFKDYSTKYTLIRNWLSHPASSKIQIQTAKEIITFVKRTILNLDDSFFWFVTKKEISKNIETFLRNIEESPLSYHNLSEVSFSYNKLVCREKELDDISDCIFGKDETYRKSGSLVIYGYGGVGKTALVLEFLYRTIKNIFDDKILEPIEFVLFYSCKDEMLKMSQTTGELYVAEIDKQISTFPDFTSKIVKTLEIEKIEDLQAKRGIVVIDNFETLPDIDKPKFLELIKKTPRSIQFIITSRNEEACEDKINLKEYRDIEKGVSFIDEFVDANDYRINLSPIIKKDLIELSKGNTLILVLTIQMINHGFDICGILSDLRNVESNNIEVIADFMYKNTINSTIEGLQLEGYNPIEILKVISLYEFPVDLYSISFLSKQEIPAVEYMCNIMSKKLVLEKQGESFKPNEFANKFILSKYIPHNIEKREIKKRIREYQKDLKKKLKLLEQRRAKEPLLDGIMEDWKPKNSIDTITIAEAFSLFADSKKASSKNNVEEITKIRKHFQRIERMTSHPYIKFQKARCHEHFLSVFKNAESKQKILKIISESFEAAIEATDFYYPYIKTTKSYASINWIYGIFLSTSMNDIPRSLRYLEDAYEIFKRNNIQDKTYYTLINNLSWAYTKLYESTSDKRYIDELKHLFNEIVHHKKKVIAHGFDFALYHKNFSKYFQKRKNTTAKPAAKPGRKK